MTVVADEILNPKAHPLTRSQYDANPFMHRLSGVGEQLCITTELDGVGVGVAVGVGVGVGVGVAVGVGVGVEDEAEKTSNTLEFE